jgi:hypothetical protein
MMLRFIVPPVNFDDITQALKGVEGQSNRQDEGQTLNRIIPMKKMGQLRKIGIKKIEIFENEKNTAR